VLVHHDLVDVLLVDEVVVFTGGFDLPAVAFEELDRGSVRRRNGVVQALVAVTRRPLDAAFEEVRSDAVPAVLLEDADGEFGGVSELLDLGMVDVDPADDLVVDARDEEQARLQFVVPEENALLFEDVRDRFRFDVVTALDGHPHRADEAGEVGFARLPDDEGDVVDVELLLGAGFERDPYVVAVDLLQDAVSFQDGDVMAERALVEADGLPEFLVPDGAMGLDVVVDRLAIVVVEVELASQFHDERYHASALSLCSRLSDTENGVVPYYVAGSGTTVDTSESHAVRAITETNVSASRKLLRWRMQVRGMRRRALLASVGLLGAGCLDTAGTGPTDDTTATTAGTTTPVRTTDVPPTDPPKDPSNAGIETCEPTTPTFDRTDSIPQDVEYVVEDVRTATTYDRPESRYLLEPSKFYSADAVEREREEADEEVVVVDIETVEDDAVRDAIKTAIEDGEWRADELPTGLAETVERIDFVTGLTENRTHTHVGVELHELPTDAPPAITFDAAVADRTVAPGDPASIALWLSNTRKTPVTVMSGTVPPFGMLRAERDDGADGEDSDDSDDSDASDASDDSDDEFLLWRDYEEEGCFSKTDEGWIRCDIAKYAEISPCESVVREYEVLPSTTEKYMDETHPPAAGTYTVTGEVRFGGRKYGDSSTLFYEVEVDVRTP